MSDLETIRRTILGGGALGLAGAVMPATAQPASADPVPSLRDPRTAYRREPFPEQRQPWPALAGRMDPRPDHGETSYRGSGKLTGRRALITGGDSGIGRAAAIAFAREGADVAIRQPAEIAALYVALASDGFSYSSGTVIGADGGEGKP